MLILKCILKEQGVEMLTGDWLCLEPVADFCHRGKEHSATMKDGKFRDHLRR